MKEEKKKEARRLRKKGRSVNDIYKKIGVAKSSVSVWVRDIKLTKEQRAKLDRREKTGRKKAANFIRNSYLQRRIEFQKKGRIKAKEKDQSHMAGCLLYWAEGSKERNSVQFGNSDPNMMKMFKDFLMTHFDLKIESLTIYINCYTNNGLKVSDIEAYWLKQLNLPASCLRKTTTNNPPQIDAGRKKGKFPYGVCKITVNKTEIVQHIYGAIQEYGSFTNDKWIW